MLINTSVQSSYQLKRIRLVEAMFKFPVEFPLDNISTQIKSTSTVVGVDIICRLRVALNQINEGNEFKIEIEMEGSFEKKGEDTLSDNEFRNISAPSIIYPYIRQQVRYLSLEATINPIILPVINFQAYYQANIAPQNNTDQ